MEVISVCVFIYAISYLPSNYCKVVHHHLDPRNIFDHSPSMAPIDDLEEARTTNAGSSLMGYLETIGVQAVPIGDREEKIKHNYSVGILKLKKMLFPVNRYRCHSCYLPDCREPHVCENALKCYSSHIRLSTGKEKFSRGCADTAEAVNAYCHAETNHTRHPNSPVSVIECCDGHMCNKNSFPPLPPLVSCEEITSQTPRLDPYLKVAINIVMPVAVVLMLLNWFVIAIQWCWHPRRKSPSSGIRPFLRKNALMSDPNDASNRGISNAGSGSASGLPRYVQTIPLQEQVGGEGWYEVCGKALGKVSLWLKKCLSPRMNPHAIGRPKSNECV